MDQKNTIVKCAMHKCLFNHCGTCDQYVITIGVDGSCTAYCETELPVEQKTCHEDCIHFDNSDPMIGPVCLFKHPEPLKEFYEGIPCDYYHKRNNIPRCEDCKYLENTGLLQRPCVKHSCYKHRLELPCEDFKPIRGQRAKCNLFDDMMNINDKHLGEAVTVKMKIAELNKPNKNKSTIKEIGHASPEGYFGVDDFL